MTTRGHGSPNGLLPSLTSGPLLAAILLCVAQQAVAEPGDLVGRVTDEAGHPLAYANVVIPSTTAGAFTREGGFFRLRLPPGPADSLRATMIGYHDTTLALPRISHLDTLRVVLRSRFDLRGNPDAAENLVRAILNSSTVEAYLVNGRLRPDMVAPNFRHYAVLATAPPPSSTVVEKFCQVLRQASRDSCGSGPSMCVFEPRYAFRFHAQPRPLELLVSGDCHDLMFCRGPELVSDGRGGGYGCVRTAIQGIVAVVFGEDSKR